MGKADKYNYGVVLDAGSSGTRVYIYRWLKNEIARQGDESLLRTLPDLETKDKWTKKVHPGVSTFGAKPESIGPDHLNDLLVHALKHIPKDAVPDTPIFLLATAGVRLLPDLQQAALLKSICSYIKTETRFLIPDCDLHVRVISGETEGLYGWIAANYLLGGFNAPQAHNHGKGHHTYGFLDMGGASAQIAFAPNATEAEKHANDLKLVRFRTIDGNVQEHKVFVTTWLGFGVNEARKRYVKALLDEFDSQTAHEYPDPCLPSGILMTLDAQVIPSKSDPKFQEAHLVGVGQFDECLKRTFPLLEKNHPCPDEPCLINGQHVPTIDFDVNHFIGISEYWHTTHEIFEKAHKDKSYDLETYQKRVKEFCEQPWSSTQAEVAEKLYGKKVDEQTAYEVCFKASWLINVLHDGIGVPRIGLEELPGTHNGTKEVIESSKHKGYLEPFQAVNKIKDTEVSWTMGKMALYASADVPAISEADASAYPVGFGSNQPGSTIPSDFQYPGGGRLQTTADTPSSGSQTLTDKLAAPFLKSDSSHRIPGFLLFLLIIAILAFYLCGRERRSRFFHRYLPQHQHPYVYSPNLGKRSPRTAAQQKLRSFLNLVLGRTGVRSPPTRDRTLEDGSNARLYDPASFELGSMNDSDDDTAMGLGLPDIAVNGSKQYSGGTAPVISGYVSPTATTKRSATPKSKPPITSSHSNLSMTSMGGINERLMASATDVIDRRGLAVRTESRERLDLAGAGGRFSRSGSMSPPR